MVFRSEVLLKLRFQVMDRLFVKFHVAVGADVLEGEGDLVGVRVCVFHYEAYLSVFVFNQHANEQDGLHRDGAQRRFDQFLQARLSFAAARRGYDV